MFVSRLVMSWTRGRCDKCRKIKRVQVTVRVGSVTRICADCIDGQRVGQPA